MAAHKNQLLIAASVLAVLWVVAPMAQAQDMAAAGGSGDTQKLDEQWEMLTHFIVLGQDQGAASYAKAILDSGASPSQIYYLTVRNPGSLATLTSGRRLKGLAEPIDQLISLVEQGYQAERSDPEQIRKAIELLSGTQRAYIRGRERLIMSGEYAVPQLLRKLEDPQITDSLREKIIVVLPKLGKNAVLPLIAGLNTMEPMLLMVIADALGKIEYPTAVPALKSIYERSEIQPQVKRIVRTALVSCAGGDTGVLQKPAAQLYYDLAVKFYYRAASLQPDMRVKLANVWFWDKDLDGLSFKAVPKEIFCDVYAVRTARQALAHDGKLYPAVSLWLAAAVKQEVDLPQGAQDPTRQADDPPAKFYVLSAGAKYQQDMLARALKDRDWPVAVAAIEALGQTTGAETLVKPVEGGAQPLVEALSCSNRVVRYWAAVSLALALPNQRYTGSELVIPVLSNALKQSGKKTAMLVAEAEETRNAMKDALRALGFEVIDAADSTQALVAARQAEGVDIAVLANAPDPMIAVNAIRRDPILSSMPIVVAAQTSRFQNLAKADPRVRLTAVSPEGDELGATVTELLAAVSGAPMTPEQSSAWAVRSAGAIRKLGLTGNATYNIMRAQSALVAGTADERGEVRTAAAEALATLPGPVSQRAIADLATDSSVDEKVRLSAFAALIESVRRFGNGLSDEQSQAIVDIVTKAPAGEIRMAAAEVLGGLSLPSSKIKDLIIQAGDVE